MKLEDESHVLHSYAGSLCTLLMFCVTILYALQKFIVLVERKDVDVLSTTLDSFFDEHHIFNYKNGFNIAAAFTSFNNEAEWELDPSYGSLELAAFKWGTYPNGAVYEFRDVLEHHFCSKEELGMEGEMGSKFFTAHHSAVKYMRDYQKKFICLD